MWKQFLTIFYKIYAELKKKQKHLKTGFSRTTHSNYTLGKKSVIDKYEIDKLDKVSGVLTVWSLTHHLLKFFPGFSHSLSVIAVYNENKALEEEGGFLYYLSFFVGQ